jgi:hypothetical protein
MARSSNVYMAIHPTDFPTGIPIRACTVKYEFTRWLSSVPEEARDKLTLWRVTDNGDRVTILNWRELLA